MSITWNAAWRNLRSVHFPNEAHGWAVGAAGTILATADGGATWTSQSSDTDAYLWSVRFTNPRRGWAVGEGGVVVATTNGGATWTRQRSGTDATLSSVSFVDASQGWAVGDRTILVTTDGGATWTVQHSGAFGLYSVHFVSPKQGWAVGGQGTILATADGGVTWTPQSSGTETDLDSVCFVSPTHGWAVGKAGTLVASADGGATWTAHDTGTVADLWSVHFSSAARGWAVGQGGTILATVDGGATWTSPSSRSGVDVDLGAVHFASATRGWAVGKGGTILATTDRGETWAPQGSSSGTDAVLASVFFTSPTDGWTVGAGGTLLVTADGGVTWARRSSGTDADLWSVCSHDPSHGWAVGSGGTVLATVDGGRSWTRQRTDTVADLWSVHFTSGTRGRAVGNGGTILATADGGATWTAQRSGTDATLLSVYFTSADQGWAAGAGGTLLATSDGGAVWSSRSDIPAVKLWSVHFTSPAHGWAVGSAGTILATADGGVTWDLRSSGTRKLLVSVYFLNATRGWAVGDAGTFVSTVDGGATWAPQDLGTGAALGSVHFVSETRGWVAGKNGVILRSSPDFAPFVSTFLPAENHARLRWTVGDDRELKDARCDLEFRIGSSQKWVKIGEGLVPEQLSGESAAFAVSWQPTSEDYRVQSGDDVHYRITLSDASHKGVVQEMPGFRYRSLPERLAQQWEGLGKRPFGRIAQGAVVLALLAGLYSGTLCALLLVRPSWLLWLSRLQVKEMIQAAGATRFVGLILDALITMTLGRYLVRHRRTRTAWIQRFLAGEGELAELDPEVREHFLSHDDVLDAWVELYAGRIRHAFLRRATVDKRRIHVPMPVLLGERTLPQLGPADLRSVFERRGCLQIWGEGGTGKTSLACQVARWAMAEAPEDRLLPHRMVAVLLEPGFTFKVGEGQNPLREAIRGQLGDAAALADPVPPELLEHLLRRRRVLGIIDGLSEMDAGTRPAIEPARAEFAAHALVVTSRQHQDMRVRSVELKPLVVEGTRLLSFLEAYFAQSGKQDLFEKDEEVYVACQQLAQMVGERDTTVLFARIFADQMIAGKEESSRTEFDLPKTLPDLMLRYLNDLNRKVKSDHLENRAVHAAAKVVAWECLRETLRPSPAALDAVDAALGGEEKAGPLLDYLDRRLGIVRTLEPGWDRIRFALDPLAEFLAGLHLVETWNSDADRWRDFLAAAERMDGAPQEIREFLLAIRDCCRAKGEEHGVPDGVAAALAELAG